ncbi:hypothetical protein SEVIR_5G296832v4 [Setaria viridis]
MQLRAFQNPTSALLLAPGLSCIFAVLTHGSASPHVFVRGHKPNRTTTSTFFASSCILYVPAKLRTCRARPQCMWSWWRLASLLRCFWSSRYQSVSFGRGHITVHIRFARTCLP